MNPTIYKLNSIFVIKWEIKKKHKYIFLGSRVFKLRFVRNAAKYFNARKMLQPKQWSNEAAQEIYPFLKNRNWRVEAEGRMSYKIDYFLSNPLHVTQISTEVLNKTPPPATSGLEVDTAFLILINTQRSHTALATHLQAPVRILFSFLLPLWSSVGDFTSHQWHLWRTLETLNVPRGRPPF